MRRTPPKVPVAIADCPVARLALLLQAEYAAPAHLDPEELAAAFCRHFKLEPPVEIEEARLVLEQLEIPLNPPGCPQELPSEMSAFNFGDIRNGKWLILADTNRSVRRQVQSIFHELYEILRDYLHQWGGEFPEGWSREKYPPERYARWFAGAVTLPRIYVLDFIARNGLDPELLQEATHTSRALVIRRLRELLPDTPLVAFQVATPKKLLQASPSACRCVDSVRSREFSVALNARNSRKYHLPRKREVWSLGPLVMRVVETGRPVQVARVTGFDLFGFRDVSAVALPVLSKGKVESVVVYAVHPESRHLFDPVAERLNPILLEQTVHLLGVILERPKPKRKKRKPHPGERTVLLKTRGGESKSLLIEQRPRRSRRVVHPSQTAMVTDLHVPVQTERDGQQGWDLDQLDPKDEFFVPTDFANPHEAKPSIVASL